MEERFISHNPEKENQNSSSVIPCDIITYDILTRVPTESLVRFRCVCKSWSDLFSDNPLFVKLHCQRYDNKSYSSGFIDVEHQVDPISHERISSLVFIDQNGKKRRITPFNNSSSTTLFSSKVHILDSLNGVLLLRCDHDDCRKYHVYNPITRCSTIIPVPINDVTLGVHCFCLCYDPLIEKHKVVLCQRTGYVLYIEKIKILTVGDGLRDGGDPWRDIVVPDAFLLSDYNFYVDKLYLSPPGCFSKRSIPHDNLHWMVKPCDSDEYYILAFDATREVYVKIKLPNEVSTLKLKCVLNVMEGLFCLSHYALGTQELRVWTLNDHYRDEDEHEWAEIRFNFSTKEVIGKFSVSSIQPLTILTVVKKKLIFACYSSFYIDRYYSYDIELKQLEIIHGPISNLVPLHWHVNSFAKF